MIIVSISVSVVIPTYNRSQLLLAAISSVLAQSHPPQEIIVVDDCSTDRTTELLEQITSQMQRGRSRVLASGGEAEFRVVRLKKHSGYPGFVRNCGVAIATSDYIAFLDDDDQWLPQKLALQVALHNTHPKCIISCSDEYWLRRGRLIAHPPPTEHSFRFASALQKCTIGPSTVMVWRECIDPRHGTGYGFEPTLELAEDYHLWLRILDRHRVRYIPQKLTLKCEYGQAQLSHKYPYIERFRINALELLLEQESLSAPHHRAAATVCADKCLLWSAGARKRGRTEEALHYERMAAYALSAAR